MSYISAGLDNGCHHHVDDYFHIGVQCDKYCSGKVQTKGYTPKSPGLNIFGGKTPHKGDDYIKCRDQQYKYLENHRHYWLDTGFIGGALSLRHL